MAACDHALVGHGDAKAAVEMAILDIQGKALGMPVHALLGGLVRSEIPLSVSIANPDFDEDMDFAHARVAEGIGIFKVKTGFLGHDADLQRMTRLRRELPEGIDLRIDYNQGLEAWDALSKVRAMEQFRPTFVEQPVQRHQVAALAAIARAVDTPIMADESCFSPEDAIALVRAEAADLVSIKIMKSGGILKARQIVAIAEAAGLACYGGTMYEGGIALTAGIHLVASTPAISLGAEFYTSTFVLAEDVLAEPVSILGGKVQVPTGPGLGIEVDAGRVAKLAVAWV
jgi:muconate cycloisomerase